MVLTRKQVRMIQECCEEYYGRRTGRVDAAQATIRQGLMTLLATSQTSFSPDGRHLDWYREWLGCSRKNEQPLFRGLYNQLCFALEC